VVLFVLQYFWKLICFFDSLKKHKKKCGTGLFCTFCTFSVKSMKKHKKSTKRKLDVFLMWKRREKPSLFSAKQEDVKNSLTEKCKNCTTAESWT